MSHFEGMHLDIKMAAKVQFALFFHTGGSAEIDKYENQTKIVNNYVENSKEIYIGGQPPASGKWIDWQQVVKSNLAPIRYTLSLIHI